MGQITFMARGSTEGDIAALKKFFGTPGTSAAIRGGILLARELARTAKNGEILIKSQDSDPDLRIVIG